MRRLSDAAFAVGGIGAAVSVPLLFLLSFVHKPFGYPRPQWRPTSAAFFASAPFLVFVLAALCFAALYVALPRVPWRARFAGVLAALLAFGVFLLWTKYAINVSNRNGNEWTSPLYPVAVAFCLVGWVPVLAGWFAGWRVESWLEEAD